VDKLLKIVQAQRKGWLSLEEASVAKQAALDELRMREPSVAGNNNADDVDVSDRDGDTDIATNTPVETQNQFDIKREQ